MLESEQGSQLFLHIEIQMLTIKTPPKAQHKVVVLHPCVQSHKNLSGQ